MLKIVTLALLHGVVYSHGVRDVCDTGYPPEIPYCARDCCTNDVEGVFGDEQMTWDHVPEFLTKTSPLDVHNCYEIGQWTLGRDDYDVVGRRCETDVLDDDGSLLIYEPPSNVFPMYAVDADHHPILGQEYFYRARACRGTLCGDWSPQYVQLIGGDYVCWDGIHHCDVECYPGSRLLNPSCQEPAWR